MNAPPIYMPGVGMVDPMTGAPMPNYMGQMSMPQGQQQTPAQQAPMQAPQTPPPQAAAPAGSTLTSALSNPLVGALIGGGLGALGGGGKGAIAGALGGPMLGANAANALNAAQTQDPTSSLAALSARYLPILAASYAGSFYRNPTAPQYGVPASQTASLAKSTPTGAPKPAAGSWYTYGELPSYQLSGQARGGMQNPPMGGSSLTTGAVAAPGETGEHYIQGPGDGTSDDVNSRLAKNEFVIPADVVSSLGNGSSDAGAEKLYGLMHKVRKERAPAMAKGKLPPKAKEPAAYMGGGE